MNAAFWNSSAVSDILEPMKTCTILLASLTLGACAIIPRAEPPAHTSPAELPSNQQSATSPADGVARAALNQRVFVDGPYVTPIAVLEDSRCPINARCVWAGRVKLTVRIDLGPRSETREIGTDAPIQVGDGQLSLVEVLPNKVAGGNTEPGTYRFGFRFAGGL